MMSRVRASHVRLSVSLDWSHRVTYLFLCLESGLVFGAMSRSGLVFSTPRSGIGPRPHATRDRLQPGPCTPPRTYLSSFPHSLMAPTHRHL